MCLDPFPVDPEEPVEPGAAVRCMAVLDWGGREGEPRDFSSGLLYCLGTGVVGGGGGGRVVVVGGGGGGGGVVVAKSL